MSSLLLAGFLSAGSLEPVLANEPCHINWGDLQLSPNQDQQIKQLDAQWNQEYMQVQPSIVEDQKKLSRLLADPRSDPLEIMALQQSIARRKEHLRASATATYLRKRQILDEGQRQALEGMIRQVISERQRMMNPGSHTDVMPDRVQDLMQRVRNIWGR